jgi:lactoylglutathione lyase
MAKLVGINHVALEVGDIDEALAWYGRFFDFELRGRAGNHMAFVDMGDQFIALARGRTQPPDSARHFGLVVDDKEGVRKALTGAGVTVTSPPDLSFRDPWGNHV